MSETVIGHVLGRLKAIGIEDVFGVPGDYAFPVNDAVVNYPGINWIGCCNELKAGYAADGYARIRGTGAVSTTYGVGELSALSALAGACAEHLPVFHLIGMPGRPVQQHRALVHHTPRRWRVRILPQNGRAGRLRQRDHDTTERRI